MPTTCKIHFDNNKNVVYSGQKICITVRLKFTENVKVRSIYIYLRGKTQVRFNLDDESKHGTYMGSENLLDMRKCLADGNGDEIVLLPGTYDYSFLCTLPHNLPSSFLAYCGFIKYTAQVVLDIPRWPDKTFKQQFIVMKPIDLNDFPSLRNPLLVQEEFTTKVKYGRPTYGSYLAGPYNISARIADGSFYLPGQSIKVEFDVENKDVQSAISFSVKLCRKIIYSKSEGSKHKLTTSQCFDNQITNGCQPKQHKNYVIYLKVPEACSPTETSKFFQVEYFIKIFSKIFCSEKNLCLFLPIRIGSKPLHHTTPGLNISQGRQMFYPSAPLLPILPSAPEQSQLPDDDTVSIRTYASTPPPFPDDELDLPTYDEAMLFNVDHDFHMNLEKVQYSFAKFSTKR